MDPAQRSSLDGAFPIHTPLPPMRARRRFAMTFALAASLMGLVAIVARSRVVSMMAPLVGLAAMGALALQERREGDRQRRARGTGARVVVGESELVMIDEAGSSRPLVDLRRPFGITVFSTPECDRLLVAISHRDGVVSLAARSDGAIDGRTSAGRTSVVFLHEDDLPQASVTFDSAATLLDLVDALAIAAPGALDRLVLADASMGDVVLDGDRLRAGGADFDLSAPIAWRMSVFDDGPAQARMRMLAVHLDQGDRATALVSLAPARRGAGRAWRDRAIERPSPKVVRASIDRIFMPRIVRALEARTTPIDAPDSRRDAERAAINARRLDAPASTPASGIAPSRTPRT